MRTVRAVRVEFDSSRKIREDEDELVVPAVLTRESILPFADGLGYRPAAELEAGCLDSGGRLGCGLQSHRHGFSHEPRGRQGQS